MKIPRRIHRDLPDDVAWIITERRGQLIVYLARDIPQGSPLEQLFVRQAVRAWQHDHQDRLLGLPPILAAGGAGLGWLINQFRRPAVAAGTAVATIAGVALAAAISTDPPEHPAPRRPPAAEAPSQTPTRTPRTSPPQASPPQTTKPRPPAEPPARSELDEDSDTGVSVEGVGRVRVPPVRTRLPAPVPTPTVTAPTPTPRPTGGCRLVRVEVGKLVRVCL